MYGGLSEAQRRAERRERLVVAGLELFGTEGWSGTTIERLCAEASVATRSFYEEFTGRDPLLREVYERVVAGSLARMLDALSSAPDAMEARVQVAVSAYVRHVTDDPRRAQVLHREVRLAGVAGRDRQASVERVADVLERALHVRLPDDDPGRHETLALALLGMVNEVLESWISSPTPRPPVGPVIAELSRLTVAALTFTAPTPSVQVDHRAGGGQA